MLSHTSDFKHPSAAKQPDPNRAFAITTPLANLTVLGHVRFRLRETCFFTCHVHFFCNGFVAEFCSGVSKKYRKNEKLQWCLKKVLM